MVRNAEFQQLFQVYSHTFRRTTDGDKGAEAEANKVAQRLAALVTDEGVDINAIKDPIGNTALSTIFSRFRDDEDKLTLINESQVDLVRWRKIE